MKPAGGTMKRAKQAAADQPIKSIGDLIGKAADLIEQIDAGGHAGVGFISSLRAAARLLSSLRELVCKRCDHRWLTKLQGRDPLICPECRDHTWAVPDELLPDRRRKKKH